MSITTYQAFTMAEALAAVRRDIGPGAIILHTRTFRRGGFLGIGRRTIVEVTARSGQTQSGAAPPPNPQAPQRGRSPGPGFPGLNAAQQAYARVASSASGKAAPARDADESSNLLERNRTRRLAQALAERHERDAAPANGPVSVAAPPIPPGGSTKNGAGTGGDAAETRTVVASPAPPVARRFVLRPAEESRSNASGSGSASLPVVSSVSPAESVAGGMISNLSPDSPGAADAAPPVLPAFPVFPAAPGSPAPAAAAMQDELASIKVMLGEVLQRQVVANGKPAPPASTMPQALFDMYLKLVSQDLSDELANRIVEQVRDELAEDLLNDEQVVRETVARHLAAYIPVADSPPGLGSGASISPDGRPFTLALVGPTGVGKTTTLAKLAATFKLRHHRKVGLITCDTYRIAAVDQLRTYAGIIGLPLEVVLTPSQMRQAMLSLGGCDVILIDTAGRGPNDTGRLDELKQFIEAARPHEVHLVLSSTASEKVLLREAEAFSRVGIDKLVLTKLDEAVSFGVLINVTRQIGTKLSFITTGQEVPNQIEAGRPLRLAELVVGGATVESRTTSVMEIGA